MTTRITPANVAAPIEPSSAAPVRSKLFLRKVLRRAYSRFAMMAIAMAAVLLFVVGWIALRAYANDNLNLVARSLAYTVEAAVVFGDNTAAHDAIALLAPNEDIAEVRLTDSHGKPFTEWHDAATRSYSIVGRLSSFALPPPVVVPISHNGHIVGTLEVVTRGRRFALFLLGGIAGVFGCLICTVGIGSLIAKRMYVDIVTPLREFADVAHAVRGERSFGRRVRPTPIVELQQLGDDFNALLEELEGWQRTLHEQNETLSHQANHDALTGLPNRAHFESQLRLAMMAANEEGKHVALLYLDCNRFKEINDALGHDAGDAVLISMAKRFRHPLRTSDLVARLGGDEFAVMLPGVKDESAAILIAQSLLDAMREPIELPDASSPIVAAISVGIALCPQHGVDVPVLLRAADEAMYRAKRAGNGGWEIAVKREAA